MKSDRKMLKFAFSLVEIMISLVVMSVILTAFTPIISKKAKPSVKVSSSVSDTFYYGPPRSQKDCSAMNPSLFYVKINDVGYCASKYNAGDMTDGVGFDIPSSALVTTVKAGTSCSDVKCCWLGTTANPSACDSSNGDYSGCKRSVCTWDAADAICSALGGRLPTTNELSALMTVNFSISKGSNGLQFCDDKLGYNSSRCLHGDNNCPGTGVSANCSPSYVWSSNTSGSSANTTWLSGGIIKTCSIPKAYARSVRCMFDKVRIGTCKKEGDCDFKCKTGEYPDENTKECKPCPIGYACNKDEKNECKAGTYTNITGQGVCKDCEIGYFCKGKSHIEKCPKGKYTDKIRQNECTTCEKGYYCTGGSNHLTCESKTENCAECNASTGTCTKCKEGYNLKNNICEPKLIDYGTTFKESDTGKYISKFNIGDKVNGVGIDIPASAGVTVVSVGTTCGNWNDYNTKCCWRGTTANQSSCDSANGNYSGCGRTVCNWPAANAICAELGGSVPDMKTIWNYMSLYSINLGAAGFQFCDKFSGYGSSYCDDGTSLCPGTSGSCYPHYVWTTSNATYVYRSFLRSGSTNAFDNGQRNAASVRCQFNNPYCPEGQYWTGSKCTARQ